MRQQPQAKRVGFVTPYADPVRAALASPSGLMSLYGRVAKASAELAFRDMFVVIVELFLVSLPLLLFVRRRDPNATAPAGGAIAHAE